MARGVCVCAALLLVTVSQAAEVIKGLYCQDPDTGKLYSINSTWPSQSFCGNYTCKLRKKNTTETEYAPLHKINITKFIERFKENDTSDMEVSPSENSITISKKPENDKQPIFHKEYLKTEKDPSITNIDKNNEEYLTEAEIKTITDMLHTVKKSDLEAIVDMYNLAQDIYKALDIENTEDLVKGLKSVDKMDVTENLKDSKQSYWYDPVRLQSKHVDLSPEGTNVLTTRQPRLDSTPTFFNGPLLEKDFGKLPYYYPISNFQRESSYVHPKQKVNDLEKSPSEPKPCSKPTGDYNYITMPWSYTQNKIPGPLTTSRPSTLLPYPFSYIYHYNVSGYQPNYYYNYPWIHSDHNRQRSYLQPYFGAYIAQIPNIQKSQISAKIIKTTGKKEKIINSKETNISEEQLLEKSRNSHEVLQEWQTEPLSENVLDEVRAFMDKPKLKPKPLQKNIKLERIGKLIKLDELARDKREVFTNDTRNSTEVYSNEYEAYIEKTTCENSTEPGYFSIGNMSQPFPGCCPKKLKSIHTAQEVIKID